MKWPFSLTLTVFLSSWRQSSNGGRFSFFIGGTITNAAEFGRQEGLPLDAGSSGGLVGRSLGKTHPQNQTNGSPYLLARSASSFKQQRLYIYRIDHNIQWQRIEGDLLLGAVGCAVGGKKMRFCLEVAGKTQI
jgi:hypothetical protein